MRFFNGEYAYWDAYEKEWLSYEEYESRRQIVEPVDVIPYYTPADNWKCFLNIYSAECIPSMIKTFVENPQNIADDVARGWAYETEGVVIPVLIFTWPFWLLLWIGEAILILVDSEEFLPPTSIEAYEQADWSMLLYYKLLSIDSQIILPTMMYFYGNDSDSELFLQQNFAGWMPIDTWPLSFSNTNVWLSLAGSLALINLFALYYGAVVYYSLYDTTSYNSRRYN